MGVFFVGVTFCIFFDFLVIEVTYPLHYIICYKNWIPVHLLPLSIMEVDATNLPNKLIP